MKYIINPILTFFVGWPMLVVGYLAGAAWSGLQIGRSTFDRHEVDCINKFIRKDKP